MRPLEALALATAVLFLATACSRLTFVRPSAKPRGFEQVAPDYRFRETADGKRRSQVRVHVARSGQALDANELEAAAREAEAALKLDPRSADALTMMALIEMARGRRAEAGGYYARAAELAPDNGGALSNYGAWLCDAGRAREAIEYFDRALAAPGYPDRAAALANAGACAEAAGQPGRAERDLREALALAPENSVALSAMAEYQYRNGRYLEARAFSQRRLAAAPATAGVLLLASQIEDKLGDRAAADRYRQRLGREFPQVLSAQPGESSPQ